MDSKQNNSQECKAVYICIHCPDVQSQEPGHCPQCGMELKKLSEIDD